MTCIHQMVLVAAVAAARAEGDLRALRGGCYRYSPRKCRSAYRGGGPVDRGFNNLGFRVALTVTP